jgi:hypothetical protein
MMGWRTWNTTFELVIVMLLLFVIALLVFLSPKVHIPYYLWTSSLSKYTQILIKVFMGVNNIGGFSMFEKHPSAFWD